MSTPFTPDFLARAAEQLSWDDTPAAQQKRLKDLALLQELTTVKPPSRMLRPALWLGSSR